MFDLVKKLVISGGLADLTKAIQVNDQMVEVNGHPIQGKSLNDVIGKPKFMFKISPPDGSRQKSVNFVLFEPKMCPPYRALAFK